MDNVSMAKVFTLPGLNETMNYKAAVFSLTLLYYCMVVFFNLSLVTIIVFDQNLHEPMYILLCSVCVNALYGTTGLYPKLLWDMLSPSPEISYTGCFVQAFVMYSFACCELSILAVMAYDRYLAICRPLHYRSLMSRRRLSQLVCFSWLTPFCVFSVSVVLTSRLRLCGTHMQKLFCVNWIIYKLACDEDDIFPNRVLSYATIIIYVSHGFFIVWTYIRLIHTSVKCKEERVKFFQTCVPHLVSLITFLVVILFDLMYMRFASTDFPQHLQNFIAIGFLLIPPMMNPLIYGFKLTKIRNRILTKLPCYKSTHVTV